MPRPVILFSGPFADMPLADLAAKAAEWGYAGLELCCWGDHIEVQHALGDPDYSAGRLALLADHDLQCPVIANHRVGQAVCDVIDDRHRSLVPDYVWGDGNPEAIRERAAAEMVATVRVAQSLGATCVSGFSGSALSSYVGGWPGRPKKPSTESSANLPADASRSWTLAGTPAFASPTKFIPAKSRSTCIQPSGRWRHWTAAKNLVSFSIRPICTGKAWTRCNSCGDFRIGFSTFTSRTRCSRSTAAVACSIRCCLQAIHGVAGISVRRAAAALTGTRSSATLNDIGYEGPLSVDWADVGLDREFGAEDACKFVKQLDVPGPTRSRQAFRGL